MPSSIQVRHLKALQVFLAVCQKGSFTGAAEALNVSQAAVSQQIRLLESDLQQPLFLRQHHQLILTPAAEKLLPHIKEGFEALARGVNQLQKQDDPYRLVITALHSFTSRWLLPRLGRFMEETEIQVFLVPTTELVDFDREGVDLGIRFGGGKYPGLHSQLLAPDHAFPVYNPATLKSRGPIEAPADLLRQRLLIDDGPTEMSWKQWFEVAGVGTVDVRPAAMIADSSMLVDAAVRGQGVALVRESLVTEELAAGRLVMPFDIRLPLNFSYYLVVPEGKRELPKVRLFVDWLMGEMGATKTGQSSVMF